MTLLIQNRVESAHFLSHHALHRAIGLRQASYNHKATASATNRSTGFLKCLSVSLTHTRGTPIAAEVHDDDEKIFALHVANAMIFQRPTGPDVEEIKPYVPNPLTVYRLA